MGLDNDEGKSPRIKLNGPGGAEFAGDAVLDDFHQRLPVAAAVLTEAIENNPAIAWRRRGRAVLAGEVQHLINPRPVAEQAGHERPLGTEDRSGGIVIFYHDDPFGKKGYWNETAHTLGGCGPNLEKTALIITYGYIYKAK